MKLRLLILLFAGLAVLAASVACSNSSGSTTTSPTISVALSPAAPASLQTNSQQSLTAVVSNDSANAGVTWRRLG